MVPLAHRLMIEICVDCAGCFQLETRIFAVVEGLDLETLETCCTRDISRRISGTGYILV